MNEVKTPRLRKLTKKKQAIKKKLKFDLGILTKICKFVLWFFFYQKVSDNDN